MLKHEGHSGFGLRVNAEDQTVTKWTQGSESHKVLLQSYKKQLVSGIDETLYPLKVVDVISFKKDRDYFQFTMPFLTYETGFTTKNHELVSRLVTQSLTIRSKVEVFGFCSIMRDFILSLRQSPETAELLQEASSLSATYPYGHTHGDMGFANMLVSHDSVYMIDFTTSFLHSPLLDIATMRLSLASPHAEQWHRDLYESLVAGPFKKYKQHINLICKALILSYAKDSMTDERSKELLDWYRGF